MPLPTFPSLWRSGAPSASLSDLTEPDQADFDPEVANICGREANELGSAGGANAAPNVSQGDVTSGPLPKPASVPEADSSAAGESCVWNGL